MSEQVFRAIIIGALAAGPRDLPRPLSMMAVDLPPPRTT